MIRTLVSARYNNTVTRAYDDAGRLTMERLTIGGQNFNVASGFDGASRRTSLTYPDGRQFNPLRTGASCPGCLLTD